MKKFILRRGDVFPRRSDIPNIVFLFAASATLIVGAMSGCVNGDLRSLRQDLGLDAIRSSRVGIAVAVFAPGLKNEDANQVMSGFLETLPYKLQARGYEPFVLYSEVLPQGIKDAAKTLRLMGDDVFRIARDTELAAVWVFRLEAYQIKPGQKRGFDYYAGDVPIIMGGCWLDSYTPQGTLTGVGEQKPEGWGHNYGSRVYRTMPPKGHGAKLAEGIVASYIKPYHGRTG